MSLSWSSAQKYKECPRRFMLEKERGWRKADEGEEARSRILGSAFHEGIRAHFAGENGVQAAREYVKQATNTEKYNYFGEIDDLYYRMMQEIEITVVDMLRTYIPWVTDRYTPVALEVPFDDGETKGIIDAIMWDNQNQEHVVVDWKTHRALPDMAQVAVDDQLVLYAYHAMGLYPGIVINAVHQVNFRTGTPKPASISAKTGQPNMGAASYDTTLDVWLATLPAGVNASKYIDEIKPKLKQQEDFCRIVELVIDEKVIEKALDNLRETGIMIDISRERNIWPGNQSTHLCKYCPFVGLCSSVWRFGTDKDIDEFLVMKGWVKDE